MKKLMLDAGYDSMSDYFRKYRSKIEICDSYCLYKKTKNRGIIYKVIQFIGIYLFPPILFMIYGSWKYHLDKYDVFIITSRRSSKYAIKYILKHCKKNNKRLIVWYWNIVSREEVSPQWCNKLGVETWSFDKKDAENYHMCYNGTYYFDGLEYKKSSIKKDIFYIGVEKKGRVELINALKRICEENGLIIDANIVKNPNYNGDGSINYVKNMDYLEILQNISESRCILDINNVNQVGLTLRPLESLFFEKKLITNNKNIKNMSFYNKNNIFIIGEDSYSDLAYFIKSPYIKINKKVVEKYKFESWLDRIIKQKKNGSGY